MARKHYEVALQTARKMGDSARIAPALFGLAQCSLEIGHLLEAEMWLKDAIPYYELGSDKPGLVEVLLVAAEVQWTEGNIHGAEKTLKAALNAVGEIRGYRQQAKTMSAVHSAWGHMYDQMGNIERAAEQYHKALDLTKDIYDRKQEAELRSSLSTIFERVGNLKSAEEHLSKAMAIHQDLKLMERWAEDNLRLARIVEMQGKPEAKKILVGQARQMYLQLGNKQKLEKLDEVSQ